MKLPLLPLLLITLLCAPLYAQGSKGMNDTLDTSSGQGEKNGDAQDDLQAQIDDLKSEIELLKSNAQEIEQKKEDQKFSVYGFMGTQLSTTKYDHPDSSLVVLGLGKTPLSFQQTHLNIYFQFDPVENWNVLSEVRFLYEPTGERTTYSPDQTTAEPYITDRFKYNGAPITQLLSQLTSTEWDGYSAALPVDAHNEVAIKFGGFLPTYDYNNDGTPDLIDSNSDGRPDAVNYMGTGTAIPFGYYPLNAQGLPTTHKNEFILVRTPVIQSVGMLEQQYSTDFIDKSDALHYNWGGVNIERAWAEWAPGDAFNIRVGKFFTPFGIWNVDHGVTVLLTPRVPYLLGYIPRTQVGLMAHGIFYLPVLDVKYDLYVSNGPSMTAAIKDDRDEKCFGGRLNLNFQSRLFNEFSLGGSGYFGKQKMQSQYIKLDYTVQNDGSNVYQTNVLKPSIDPFIVEYIDLQETLLGVDLKVNLKGFTIQAEGIYRKFKYRKYDDDYIQSHFFMNFNPENPDVWAYYVQPSYKLPFSICGVKFTPYFRYEYTLRKVNSEQSLIPMPDRGRFEIFSGGLNIRQNPYVVYKLNYTYANFSKYHNENFNVYTGALAISF